VDDDGTTTTKDSDSTKLTGGDNKDSLLDPERPSSSGKTSSESGSGGNDKTEREKDASTVSESSSKSEALPGKGSDVDVAVAQQDALSPTPESADTSDTKINKKSAPVSASVSCDPADSSSPEAAGEGQETGEKAGDALESDIESEKKENEKEIKESTADAPAGEIKDDDAAIARAEGDKTESCTNNATTNISTTTTTTTTITNTTTNNPSSKAANSNNTTDNANSNSHLGLDEEESVAGSYPPTVAAVEDATTMWPSMQDLNTRLRRVITAYQRNYKKEELKLQQKAKVSTDSLSLTNPVYPIICSSLSPPSHHSHSFITEKYQYISIQRKKALN